MHTPAKTDGHTLASMAQPRDAEGTQSNGRGPADWTLDCQRWCTCPVPPQSFWFARMTRDQRARRARAAGVCRSPTLS